MDPTQGPSTDQQILAELQELNGRMAKIRRKPFKMHMTVQVFVAVVAANLATLFIIAIGLPILGVAILGAGAAGAAASGSGDSDDGGSSSSYLGEQRERMDDEPSEPSDVDPPA
ncbi:MAG: hypothetical protein NCW75_05615 [Phycisphaera sp.]|nr:MAG: hypothetical protein NCW75_05615 [Phycisphaera sp.]